MVTPLECQKRVRNCTWEAWLSLTLSFQMNFPFNLHQEAWS